MSVQYINNYVSAFMWRVSVQYIRTSSHVEWCCSINSLVQNVLRTKLGYQPLHQRIKYIYIYIYI